MVFLFTVEEAVLFEETFTLSYINLEYLILNLFNHYLFFRISHIAFLFGTLKYYFETHEFKHTDFIDHYF